MKLISSLLALLSAHLVLGQGALREQDERETQGSFLCTFLMRMLVRSRGLKCGCKLNLLFGRKVGFNCKSNFCIGGKDGICVEPKLESTWKFGRGMTTNLCTEAVTDLTLDLTKQGSGVQTFDVPEFCLNIDHNSGLPTFQSCTAQLGEYNCACSICGVAGLDVAVDCSGSPDLPVEVASVADFGCLGMSSFFNFQAVDPVNNPIDETPTGLYSNVEGIPPNPFLVLASNENEAN